MSVRRRNPGRRTPTTSPRATIQPHAATPGHRRNLRSVIGLNHSGVWRRCRFPFDAQTATIDPTGADPTGADPTGGDPTRGDTASRLVESLRSRVSVRWDHDNPRQASSKPRSEQTSIRHHAASRFRCQRSVRTPPARVSRKPDPDTTAKRSRNTPSGTTAQPAGRSGRAKTSNPAASGDFGCHQSAGFAARLMPPGTNARSTRFSPGTQTRRRPARRLRNRCRRQPRRHPSPRHSPAASSRSRTSS